MPIRVLIAEDEWLTAMVLRSQVESHGLEVVATVGTGTEAIEACASTPPDLVLMDVQMPGMDGLQATRALMESSPTCVVIVTGRGQLREEAEQAGAMSYVVKPLLAHQIPQRPSPGGTSATRAVGWPVAACFATTSRPSRCMPRLGT